MSDISLPNRKNPCKLLNKKERIGQNSLYRQECSGMTGKSNKNVWRCLKMPVWRTNVFLYERIFQLKNIEESEISTGDFVKRRDICRVVWNLNKKHNRISLS